MARLLRCYCLTPLLTLTAITAVMTGPADAQPSCSLPERPLVGFGVGRSSPYVDLDPDAVDPNQPGSILVHSGWQIGGRFDFSIADPVRVRVDASTARWAVDRQTYSPSGETTKTSEGHISVRQLGGAIGLRGGRTPVCWYVLAGGGLYSLTFRDDTVRRPGFSLTPGIEIPTGARGRVQVEVQLHIIDTQNQPPISGSAALAAAIVAGWAYRF